MERGKGIGLRNMHISSKILPMVMGLALFFNFQVRAMDDFIEKIDAGCAINWTTGSLNVSGFQEAEKRIDGDFVDSEKALMDAKLMAHNNLLKAAKALRINGNITVGEFADNDENVMVNLMGIIKSTPVTAQQFSTNGIVEVFMNRSFYGGFSQLVLPKEIEHVESIISFKNNKESQSQMDQVNPEEGQKEIFSGLVVDARGLGVKPVLSPKIIDENNQEIYGPAFVSREIAVQEGISIYESNIAAAKVNGRVLDKPLVVKAIRTKQERGLALVISNTDALKIKSASEHLAFLKQCRVIIVVDE